MTLQDARQAASAGWPDCTACPAPPRQATGLQAELQQIIVAHRNETLATTESVVVLSQGRIAHDSSVADAPATTPIPHPVGALA